MCAGLWRQHTLTVTHDDLVTSVYLSLFSIVVEILTLGPHRNARWLSLLFNRLGLLLDHLLDLGCIALFLQDPIVLEIGLVAVLAHDVFKQLSQVVVVRFLFELHVAAVLEVLGELLRGASGYFRDASLNFLFFDSVVFFVFVLSRKTLPWQGSFQKVQ